MVKEITRKKLVFILPVLMRHKSRGRMVLGPTVGWMPVWPIPNCQGYDEKNAPGVQVITDRALLPISKLRDCEYVVKVSIFVIEGTVVEEELPQDVQWVVLFANASKRPLPPPPPKMIPDLSKNRRDIFFSDKT
ncbi:MAG: hypothetical protein ACUVQY_00620 [Thermoproteota archaeon]